MLCHLIYFRQYSKDEILIFSELLAELIVLLETEPADILGSLYMELELGNNKAGQFFTPPHISKIMAELVYNKDLDKLTKPFVTLSEPACGAGGMVLAFTNILITNGHNPFYKMWVQCIDIDRLAAFMCYVQLSLWNVPAEIVVGNALSLKVREVFHTPAHHLGCWESKLKADRVEKEKEKTKPVFLKSGDVAKQEVVQVEFDF